MPKILSLDVSSKTGYAFLNDFNILEMGLLRVEIEDFNVNKEPNKSPKYPFNIHKAAEEMAALVFEKYQSLQPDFVVIENTTKSRNRNTQRLLEWIHKSIMDKFLSSGVKFYYLDPSEWRKILEIRLSKEDKKNNQLVSKGKKKGRIGKKHLSVRWVNDKFGLKLKLKDNDIADALALCAAAQEKFKV